MNGKKIKVDGGKLQTERVNHGYALPEDLAEEFAIFHKSAGRITYDQIAGDKKYGRLLDLLRRKHSLVPLEEFKKDFGAYRADLYLSVSWIEKLEAPASSSPEVQTSKWHAEKVAAMLGISLEQILRQEGSPENPLSPQPSAYTFAVRGSQRDADSPKKYGAYADGQRREADRALALAIPEHLLRRRLIARDAEVRTLVKKLKEHRLITIHGQGCLGKTTLAVACAKKFHQQKGTSIYFIDFTGATLASQVAERLAGCFGWEDSVQPEQKQAHEMLGSSLRAKGEVLLILDAFEGVREHALTTILQWLNCAPQLRCLVTSRKRLDVEGEETYPIQPLTFPLPAELAKLSGKQLAAFSSFQMFTVLVRDWRLKLPWREEATFRLIGRVCAHTGGFPGPLELAATRLKDKVPLADVADTIEVVFSPPDEGDPHPRRYLYPILEAHFNDLNETERLCWLQAAQFRNGFTLQDAAAIFLSPEGSPVCGEGTSLASIETILRKLEFRHLLVSEIFTTRRGDPQRCFGLYLPIEEWAKSQWVKKVPESIRDEHDRRFHARFVQVFSRLNADLLTKDRSRGLQGMRYGRDNLVEALRWSLRRRDVERSTSAMSALIPTLRMHGPAAVFSDLLEQVLAIVPEEKVELRARYLRELSEARWSQGQIQDGEHSAQHAIAQAMMLASKTNDERLHCSCEAWLLKLKVDNKEDVEDAVKALRERALRSGDGPLLCQLTISRCSKQNSRGQTKDSLRLFDEVDSVVRASDNLTYARLLNARGLTLWRHGQLPLAAKVLRQAARLNQEMEDYIWLGGNLTNLALVLMDAHQLPQARKALSVAQRHFIDQGSRGWEMVNRVAHARFYLRSADYRKCIDYIEKNEQAILTVTDKQTAALLKAVWGVALAKAGELEKALTKLREAYGQLKENGEQRMFRYFAVCATASLCAATSKENTGFDEFVREGKTVVEALRIDDKHPVRYVREHYKRWQAMLARH